VSAFFVESLGKLGSFPSAFLSCDAGSSSSFFPLIPLPFALVVLAVAPTLRALTLTA